MSKRVTALAGALFLVWLLFSPIIALVLIAKVYPDFTFVPMILSILSTYLVLGIIFYHIAKSFGGIIEKQRPEDLIPPEDLIRVRAGLNSDWLNISLLGSPLLLFPPVMATGTRFPIFSGIIGLALFICTCAANWYP